MKLIDIITNLVYEFIVRLKMKSPKVFVQLQWWSGIITALITGLLILNSYFNFGFGEIYLFKIPVTVILGSIVTFLSGIFITAKTTVHDKNELDKKLAK